MGFIMGKVTIETLNDSVEKIAQYLITEVPRRSEVATKEDLKQKADKKDVDKLLEGQDKIIKELEIIRTEQVSFNHAIDRIEERVENLEKVH